MNPPSSLTRGAVLAAALAAASLGIASPSQAAVHYLFELIGDGPVVGSFAYSTANFITADVSVAPADLDSCMPTPGATCRAQDFHVSSVGFLSGQTDLADIVGFGVKFPAGGVTSFHYFANGAFGAVGVYTATILPGDNSRLTVTQDAAPGVPEPAAWALMLLGFGAGGAALRNRPTRMSA